jgi:SsrA-binding protein
MVKEVGRKLIAQNKAARHDYFIDETYECGLVLTGTEVKSLRAGRASLLDGFALINDGEVWLHGIHIPEYNEGSWTNHLPRRDRKLLMHKKEILKLMGTIKKGGYTLVPISLYFKDGRAKVEIGLARGKKSHDKRQDLLAKEASREAQRAVSRRSSGKDY